MIAAIVELFPDFLAAMILVAAALILFSLMRRSPKWRRVRLGVYLERETFGSDNSDDNEERQ